MLAVTDVVVTSEIAMSADRRDKLLRGLNLLRAAFDETDSDEDPDGPSACFRESGGGFDSGSDDGGWQWADADAM